MVDFAYLINESDEPQKIQSPLLRQGGMIGTIPGGLVLAQGGAVVIPPGHACRMPFVVFNQVMTKRTQFKRIDEKQYNKLAMEAPAIKGTQCAWGLLHPDTADCDEAAVKGSPFCEHHAGKVDTFVQGEVAMATDTTPEVSEEQPEPGPGEALADETIAEGNAATDETPVEQAVNVDPCACAKCGRVLKSPLGKLSHETHCNGTPPAA